MDIKFERMRHFLVVAQEGSLCAASKVLGITQPHLGRMMTDLENQVNLKLFVKHSRGLHLTKHGREFVELCNEIVGKFIHGTTIIREKDYIANQTLKVITGMGTIERLFKKLPSFNKDYPNINVEFSSLVNVFQANEFLVGNIDVGVIPVKFNDPNIIEKHLFDMCLRVYASPNYLKSNPPISSIKDLKDHKLILYSGQEQKVFNSHLFDLETKDFYNSPHMIVDSGFSMKNALINGLGIGCYAYNKEMVNSNKLVDVVPELDDQKIPYYYTYHRRIAETNKVNVFHEFLKDVIRVWNRP